MPHETEVHARNWRTRTETEVQWFKVSKNIFVAKGSYLYKMLVLQPMYIISNKYVKGYTGGGVNYLFLSLKGELSEVFSGGGILVLLTS